MVELYADGASLNLMHTFGDDVSGFTTNPSLCRSLGVTNYLDFAKAALRIAHGKPVSIEVLADDTAGMYRQAHAIAELGENAVVKIPIVNSRGDSMISVIEGLSQKHILINVTAIFTLGQAQKVIEALRDSTAILSVFAGRIADTGRDPEDTARAVVQAATGRARVLWASTREPFNVVQADRCGVDIITVAPSMIEKIKKLRGYNLVEYSRETVAQFVEDAKGFTL